MRNNKATGVAKPVQFFLPERLRSDRALSAEDIAKFLDDFQALAHGQEGKRKLISLRVPENLLEVFKEKARGQGVAYQTQIVALMRKWILLGE